MRPLLLRDWQSEALTQALEKYNTRSNVYSVVATPGGGKTIFAAVLAKKLVDQGDIDMVVCVSPSVTVSEGFKEDFEVHAGISMHGRIGAKGICLTYQALSTLSPELMDAFSSQRFFLVLDEVHHCGGQETIAANAWGRDVIQKLKVNSKYVLNLSGTPWRSDRRPVTTFQYLKDEQKLHADYHYSLSQAISDNVCRVPKVVCIDHDRIRFEQRPGKSEDFNSISSLMETKRSAYQNLLENEKLIRHVFDNACKQLDSIRVHSPDAAGLVVATNVKHANRLAKWLQERTDEKPEVVHSSMDNAINKIKAFKNGNAKWIVSIGMISEGTNIPRLQVCCCLSRIRTELYFRQLLGRILRKRQPVECSPAWMYIIAEPTIVGYANALESDLPEHEVIMHSMPDKLNPYNEHSTQVTTPLSDLTSINLEYPLIEFSDDRQNTYEMGSGCEPQLLFSGNFLSRFIALKFS